MDARYTGYFHPTPQQQRAETVAYYKAQQAAKQRNQLAQAYLAQTSGGRGAAPPQHQYRCERCGI